MSSTKSSRIKLIDRDLSLNPKCIHGPTLLFQVNSSEQYFSCSSCRRRKDCDFYITFDDWIKNKSSIKPNSKPNDSNNDENGLKQTFKYVYNKSVFDLKTSQRSFCTNCSQLLLNEQQLNEHKSHELIFNITKKQLKSPTKLLNSLCNNKFEAQYLFSTETIKFIIKQIIKKNNYKSVVCIGCPTIHEYIECRKVKLNINSILLDIDQRFKQFYSPEKYIKFNLFNNYFFDGQKAEKMFNKFMKKSSKEPIILIIDPPFGGLIEAMTQTINKISQIWRQCNEITNSEQLMPILLFFPYFNENRIITSMPSLSMSDFMVDYRNHNKFKGDSGRKFGSPVRIYTNIDLSSIVLPQSEGYYYCDYCYKYVSKNNKHCFECNGCTAKDGKPYQHCYSCKRCVKSTWIHCSRCGYCHLRQQLCERDYSSSNTKTISNKRRKK